jgi:hypothetical protein
MDEFRERVGVGSALGSVVAAMAYVGQRLWERTQGQGADPLLVLHDPRIAFHGRVLAATWWGGTAFFFALMLLVRLEHRERAVRLLVRASLPLVLALAGLAYVLP